MSHARISLPEDHIADFCRRNHIRRLALFGSVLRDDFTPQSDVDVLVAFEPGHLPGLAFFGMQDQAVRHRRTPGGPQHAQRVEPLLP